MKMKKWISFILCVLIACSSIVAFAEEDYQFVEVERLERVKALGIMEGEPDGEFDLYRILTRAELAKIAVKMYEPYFWDYIEMQPQRFPDVTEEHWAYSYIQYAGQAGIMNGHEDGMFMPEAEATIDEVVKVMVNILGYSFQAENTGGYPHGYVMTAQRLGLTERLSVKTDKGIARAEMAEMAAMALDVPLMVEKAEGEYVICDGTVLPEYPKMTLAIKNYPSAE